jgi:hypothetical protein
LSMTAHIPFIGLLGVKHSLPGLPAQSLRSKKIWMAAAGDIPYRPLSRCNASKDK